MYDILDGLKEMTYILNEILELPEDKRESKSSDNYEKMGTTVYYHFGFVTGKFNKGDYRYEYSYEENMKNKTKANIQLWKPSGSEKINM